VQKLTNYLTPTSRKLRSETLWNVTDEQLAEIYECDLAEVEFAESDEGDEIAIVRGEVLGVVQRF